MSSLQIVLKYLSELDPRELSVVLKEVLVRRRRTERVQSVLARYKGRGKGVWTEDAQQEVNRLRDGDRF